MSARQRLARMGRAIDLCVYCPKLCRHVCPVAVEEATETSTPWGLVTLVGLIRDGFDEPSASWANALQHCSGCGRCQRACLHHNDVTLPILAGRAVALEEGLAPAAVRERVAGFAHHSAALANNLRTAFGSSEGHAAAAYIPGCAVLEAEDGIQQVQRSIALLERLGIGRVEVFGRDVPPGACCGAPLRWAGDREGFTAHGRRLVERLADVSMIVVDDPDCAETLRMLPDYGVAPALPIQTTAEVLRQALLNLAPRRKGPAIVVHEPCATQRSAGGAEALREVAGSLAREVRFLPDGERSSACCGNGGLLPETVPDTARALAVHLGGEADRVRHSPDETLVTASPGCAAHLRAAGVPVRTLWDLLEEALGPA